MSNQCWRRRPYPYVFLILYYNNHSQIIHKRSRCSPLIRSHGVHPAPLIHLYKTSGHYPHKAPHESPPSPSHQTSHARHIPDNAGEQPLSPSPRTRHASVLYFFSFQNSLSPKSKTPHHHSSPNKASSLWATTLSSHLLGATSSKKQTSNACMLW